MNKKPDCPHDIKRDQSFFMLNLKHNGYLF